MSNNLRETRKSVGMTLTELARRADASRETITKIELHGQVPNGILMLRIARALNKDPRDIFFDTSGVQEQQSEQSVKELK